MKKNILFLTLFFSLIGFSQEQVMLDIRSQLGNSFMGKASLKILNSSNQTLYDTFGLKVENYGVVFNLSPSSFPLTIVWQPGVLNCDLNSSPFESIFTYTYSYSDYTTGKNFSATMCLFPDTFFSIYSPYINQLTAATSTIGICEGVNLASGYPHYYSIDDLNWNIAYNNIPFSFFTFIPKDLLGSNFRGNLKIKSTISSFFANPAVTMQSKIISYNVISCSPALEIDPPLTLKTVCNNESTGSVILKFKTTIGDNEQLFLNLFKNASPPILIDNLFVPKSSIINNEFTWTGFEKGNYIIKYQVQSISDNSEILNSSVVITDEFIVESPMPLKFEIKKADNPKCANDPVEISIAVTGGTGNYKFYVDGVEKTNPKPVKETDGYYHINGLIPTAINNIKVMDTNNCIETTP
ncbi:MAG: hypothetical protein ABI576_11840 [Flavobacterium sp.]